LALSNSVKKFSKKNFKANLKSLLNKQMTQS
jgi:hypothetical protein